MKILAIEHDPVSGHVLTRLLSQNNHDVTVVRSDRDALELLAEDRYDVVITDFKQQDVDAEELCRAVRATPWDLYTYIIISSSLITDEARRAAFAAGADDFLPKSIDPESLLVRIGVAQRFLDSQERLINRSEQLMQKQKELSSINVDLCEQITVDSLTGLKNHCAFFEELQRCFQFAARYNTPLALLMLDVDFFKRFNDTHGHLAGDDVLRSVGALLKSSVRTHDLVARYGGEEFAVILPMTDSENALLLAERLRGTISNHDWDLQPVTASFGISSLSPLMENCEDLVFQADRALYKSKHAGRNCSTVYSTEDALADELPSRRANDIRFKDAQPD